MALCWVKEDVASVSEPRLMELVERARRGDAAAFEGIVRATVGMVYSQVVMVVRDRQRAEDVTQEVFLGAWKGIGMLKEAEGFVGWLMTLARNRALDAVKFEGRLKRKGAVGGAAVGEGAEAVADGGATAVEELERREVRERAVRMLEELPEEYRRVLMMRYLGGCDYETIRGALGVTDGALRGLLNRGMAMLRERMTRAEK